MIHTLRKTIAQTAWMLWLTCVCLASTAWASEHITARSYWEDATSQATLEVAQSKTFTPYQGVLSRGYTPAAIWIRLDIAPPANAQANDALVLRIRPVFLDEITLFDPLDTSGKNRKAGDTADYRDNEYKSLAHTFVIPAGSQPRAVWMRVKTTSTCLVNIEAFTSAQMQDSEYQLMMHYFMVLAIVAMFILLVLINWFNNQESLYALFVVRQIYYFFYTASLFGFHRVLLSDVMDGPQLDKLYSWIVIGATASSFGFEWKFLNEYAPPRWVKVVMASLLAGSMCVIVCMLFGYTFVALRLNILLSAVGIITLLVLSSVFIDDKKLQANPTAPLLRKKIVVGYYLSVNLVLVFSLMPYLGAMKGNEFAVNGLVFYTLCSGLIMTVLMQLRAHNINKAQRAFEQQLLMSQQQVDLEKQRREEQTHLFHMLMHEIKNPLAIIDMALLAKNDLQKTSTYVSRAVNNMKDILDRCVKADKLTEGNVTIYKEPVLVAPFLKRLLADDSRKDAHIELVASSDLQVTTDTQFLDIMLSNLLDNAMRYGDVMMPVTVHAQATRNDAGDIGVKISVANRPGSASWPDADKVFKKYYRSAGAEAQSGTGLGLYLVSTLATLVGGHCRYVPDEKNIRFELWLPS